MLTIRNCRSRGFTLIEVIVSVAIMSICLVMVMRLFSAGLRASRSSCDYTRAMVHAKEKMEELSFKPEAGSGDFDDGFKWEAELVPYMFSEEARYNLWQLKVKISWTTAVTKESSIELVSLKALTNDEAT
ncbi:MAG: type II secretion system protein [Thermodesulfovibrionia bacterium]|nr:type II secretion system protein [Thermodesulfovibrionia bacterium]